VLFILLFTERRSKLLKKEKKEPSFGDIKAFLGEGTEFKGTLSFEGTVRIDGKIEGEIISKDLLIVGETAFIKAEIDVGRIINSGSIEGNISAQQRIEILPPGSVKGHIRTPNLILMEGAKFNGTCEMTSAESVDAGIEAPPQAQTRKG
jgi:cytoskeletal protein CcmA (bactofilin family)